MEPPGPCHHPAIEARTANIGPRVTLIRCRSCGWMSVQGAGDRWVDPARCTRAELIETMFQLASIALENARR